MQEEAPKTHKKTYGWLKPHQFKKGNPGGPGRPKGKTMKTWLKEYFAKLTDEERAEFLDQIDPIKAWEMAEGKPDTKADVTSGGEKIQTGVIVLPPQDENSLETTTETDPGPEDQS